ncbi:MAG: bifunctional folylpolyglutamate synthase/dihydrofolate synthase, partial [Ignavibacteriales bacterium]|nr:bifunctional folylpolyglutamate synthase/dihydrofolate synthase [Ignavibacteriales bacterium]
MSSAVLEYLYNLQKFGIKLGLLNIRSILRSLGNPEKNFPIVHIAGTNGKGSTSSIIAAALTAAGFRVGLYTSPHLVRFNERIRINGRIISDADLVRYTAAVRASVDARRATFFEATTAIAFQYFSDRAVDIVVVETGLGGRYDATKVVTPLVSVITSIAKDHTEQLGSSITRIAYEKGGIIKRRVPVIYGGTNKTAERELRIIASGKQSRFLLRRTNASILESHPFDNGQQVTLLSPRALYEDVFLSLSGDYQRENFATAILALEILADKGFPCDNKSIRKGMADVSGLSGLRGRCEWLQRRPMVLLDVAHNPDAIRQLVHYLESVRHTGLRIVFGVMKDKDYSEMIRRLAPLRPVVYAVSPSTDRALSVGALSDVLRAEGFHTERYQSVASGVAAALSDQKRGELVLITGSHYVAGEAVQWWNVHRKQARE